MKTVTYLDASSGVAGDMFVGALLDLGGSAQKVREALASLPFDGYALSMDKVNRWALAGTQFTVVLDSEKEHVVHHTHHAHAHRHLAEIEALLSAGNLSPRVRDLALRTFRIVAQAEAKAHGVSVEAVHFHEVGAVDSICDIVAAAVLVEDLGIEDVVVTSLAEGGGFVNCAHGALPVPVPAVVNVAERYGIPLELGTAQTELVTPTGIALVAALCTRQTLPPKTRIVKSGVGFGTREIGRPNCLRVFSLACEEEPVSTAVVQLETNVDDVTGEALGVTMDRLFAKGALDVSFSPCFMKKNRPGWLVRVIAQADRVMDLERILFAETTTIGIRQIPITRDVMTRLEDFVTVEGMRIRVKRCAWGDIVRAYPEAEDVREVSDGLGLPFLEVMARAQAQATVRS